LRDLVVGEFNILKWVFSGVDVLMWTEHMISRSSCLYSHKN